jgi:hypothetical protein
VEDRHEILLGREEMTTTFEMVRYDKHSCWTLLAELADDVGQQNSRRVQPDDFTTPFEQ